MSTSERRIVCRNCGETFDVDEGNCPSCGTGVRGYKGPIAMLGVGLLILLLGVQSGGWMYVIVGIVIAVGGGYLIYDQRQRFRETPGTESES